MAWAGPLEIIYSYYIDPAGDDVAGDGSLGNPWASLSKALSMMVNGESVGVNDGTYAAENNVSSALNSITIAATSGASPIFLCIAPTSPWTKTLGRTNVYEAGTVQPYGVHDDTVRLAEEVSIANVDANEDTFYWAANICYVHVAGGIDPDSRGPMYLATTSAIQYTFSGDDVAITGCAFEHGMRCLNLTGDRPTLTSCEFNYWNNYFTGFETVSVAGAGAVLDTCVFHDLYYAQAGEAIEVEVTASGCTITGCTIDDAKHAVTILGGNNHTITSCTIHTTRAYAIAAFGGTGHVISYSTMYQVDHGITINGAATTATVHHNVVYTTGPGTFEAGTRYAFVAETGATALFYHCIAANGQLGTLAGIGWYIQTAGTTATVINCASYNNDTGFAEGAGGPTITADYNGSYDDTVDYGGGFPNGAHDLAGDPAYTNPGADDYTLQIGSPYRGAGTFVAGVSEQNPPTIGRWEYAT